MESLESNNNNTKKLCGCLYPQCSCRYDDKKYVLDAVRIRGYGFKFASDTLKKDKEFLIEAIRINVYVYLYIDDSLKRDRDIILETVRRDGLFLEHMPNDVQDDVTIVSEAVKQNKLALKYASDAVKNSFQTVQNTFQSVNKSDNKEYDFIDLLNDYHKNSEELEKYAKLHDIDLSHREKVPTAEEFMATVAELKKK